MCSQVRKLVHLSHRRWVRIDYPPAVLRSSRVSVQLGARVIRFKDLTFLPGQLHVPPFDITDDEDSVAHRDVRVTQHLNVLLGYEVLMNINPGANLIFPKSTTTSARDLVQDSASTIVHEAQDSGSPLDLRFELMYPRIGVSREYPAQVVLRHVRARNARVAYRAAMPALRLAQHVDHRLLTRVPEHHATAEIEERLH